MTTTATAHETLAGRRPLIFYFALTYAISWPFFLLASQLGGSLRTLVIVIGGFGPAVAAAVTIWRSGGSLREWARGIVRWRVPVGYYLYALGLPVLIMIVMNLVLAVLGQQPAWSSLLDRAPAYLQTFLMTLVFIGGQEEPGWRGFALPRLQARHSPMVATLLLGLAWGGARLTRTSVLRPVVIRIDLRNRIPRLEIPVYFLEGTYDYTCATELARDYFRKLDAPMKGFYEFGDSAHSPVLEEPAEAHRILQTDVLAGTNALADLR